MVITNINKNCRKTFLVPEDINMSNSFSVLVGFDPRRLQDGPEYSAWGGDG